MTKGVGPTRWRSGMGALSCPHPPAAPQLSSFEVPLRFAIVSFATHTHVIISTIEDDASDADEVIARLEAMNFGGTSPQWATPKLGMHWGHSDMVLSPQCTGTQRGPTCMGRCWRSTT